MARADDTVRYCPDWSAANKSGRRKNSDKQLTVSERIELASASKKRKRRAKLYCKICHKFNHNTADCFKNPINCTLDERLADDDNCDEEEYNYDEDELGQDGNQDGDQGTV